MSILQRLQARLPTPGSAARADENRVDSLPSYARWLNDALTQLAENLLLAAAWGAPPDASSTDAAIHARRRLRESRQGLQQLREETAQHRAPASQASTHDEYVELVARCLGALEGLEQGLATTDADAIKDASLQLGQLTAAAENLHSRVIEWALPYIAGG